MPSDPVTLWATPDGVDISAIADEATLEQIVQVLEGMGAKRRQWHGPIAMHPKGRPDLGDDLEPGTYLVLRIEDE